MHCGMILSPFAKEIAAEKMVPTAAGLRALGHTTEVRLPHEYVWDTEPDLLFVFNSPRFTPQLVRGRPCVILERGFFDRMNHMQLDHVGFNHTASWASKLQYNAPNEGTGRLSRVCGDVRPVKARDAGYVLAILQVTADMQLKDSEIKRPEQLLNALVEAVPPGVELCARTHPMAIRPLEPVEGVKILGGTLAENVAGARFVVTINSNAGNEALAMGCPVLAFGPALYTTAQVATRTNLKYLFDRIDFMLRGVLAGGNADNYLRWLACRQWHTSELAEGAVLEPIINAAMTQKASD